MAPDFKNKKVTVVGLGRSGYASALLLKEKGAKVKVTDSGSSPDVRKHAEELKKRGIEVETGRHSLQFVSGQDLIVTSPGVPDEALPLQTAKKEAIPVWSEIELGYNFCDADIIAVTGTNGKSTVTTLLGEIMKKSGRHTLICGNIGNPFCGALDGLNPSSIVVLEVSSFQLEHVVSFRPKVGLILNLSQNHLNRHGDFDAYKEAKARILMNQGKNDWAVLNYGDKEVRSLKTRCRARVVYFSGTPFPKEGEGECSGAYRDKDELIISLEGKREMLCRSGELKIKGEHNIENALAAGLASCLVGADPGAVRAALKEFPGLEHRCEYLGELRGVHFINDSKSTTPEATRRALEISPGPAVLIAGGRDKGSDFNTIRDIVSKKAKALVLIGEAAPVLERTFSSILPVRRKSSLNDALLEAISLAVPGDCVLLSPMCTSFDMFRDFEERGKVFKEAVRILCEKRASKSC